MTGSETPIVAILAEGDASVRRIGAALAEAGIPVAVAVAHPDGLALVDVDVVVLGDEQSKPVTAKLVKRLRTVGPDLRFVALMPDDASPAARRAVQAGLDGLVRESDVESALGATVRAVCAGQVVVPREARSQLPAGALSYREKQILGMVVEGYTNAEIGQRLFLAESTVKSHLTSSFSKLGVRSRSEAAAAVTDPDGGLGLAMANSGSRDALIS